METFFVGLILLAAGLAGVFWGYRIFRILLPILGGVAGYLIAIALLPDNLFLALVIGFGLALLLAVFAYTMWSIMVAVSGVILGAALGAGIAAGLNLWNWLGWILIIVLAVVGGILVWKIRDEFVIILTAIAGAAIVATGLRIWFGEGTIKSFLWIVIFIVLAIIGIAWQWRRYRHLQLFGMGGPAEMPAATRAAPVVGVGAPVAAAPALAPAVAAGAVVAETKAEAEPVVVEAAAPVVEPAAPVVEVAPAVAAGAVVEAAKAEAEPVVVEAAAPVVEATAPVEEAAPAVAASAFTAVVEGESAVEEPPAPEVAVEQPAVEAVRAADLDQLEAIPDGTDQAALQEKIEFVEGIGPSYAGKLKDAGIDTVLDLLRRGATRKGRAELAEATGIAAGLIMKWVNHADLFRIKGVSKQFGELLEAAGVDTVPELAQRNPVNLFNKLGEVNAEKKLVGRSPHQAEVDNWVNQAKNLPRIVEY